MKDYSLLHHLLESIHYNGVLCTSYLKYYVPYYSQGVVMTHGNLVAMTGGMVQSWEWTDKDVVLHVLPLHHVHGIVNVLLTPLTCGATCVMEPKFDAARVSKFSDEIGARYFFRVSISIEMWPLWTIGHFPWLLCQFNIS